MLRNLDYQLIMCLGYIRVPNAQPTGWVWLVEGFSLAHGASGRPRSSGVGPAKQFWTMGPHRKQPSVSRGGKQVEWDATYQVHLPQHQHRMAWPTAAVAHHTTTRSRSSLQGAPWPGSGPEDRVSLTTLDYMDCVRSFFRIDDCYISKRKKKIAFIIRCC